ncbi:hypothetical protein ACTMQS_10495 [Pseudomonas syringae pv. aptata]|uniref:hypothetical protein n=1 Tax=Pseudomonas syringae TaxID=317 RepID=UPI003F8AD398
MGAKSSVSRVTVEPAASWTFSDRQLPGGIPYQWHYHPEFELTLTLNSRGYRYIGDDVSDYDDGDLVLVGPGIAHSWCSTSVIDAARPHQALVIKFSQSWVDSLVLYRFTDIPDDSGADMVRGQRTANNVAITFVFDRNEATSSSARTEWLLGVRHLGCLLRVNKLSRDLKGALRIEATALGIRSAHEELKSRMYDTGLYESGLIGCVDEDEEAYPYACEDELGDEPDDPVLFR